MATRSGITENGSLVRYSVAIRSGTDRLFRGCRCFRRHRRVVPRPRCAESARRWCSHSITSHPRRGSVPPAPRHSARTLGPTDSVAGEWMGLTSTSTASPRSTMPNVQLFIFFSSIVDRSNNDKNKSNHNICNRSDHFVSSTFVRDAGNISFQYNGDDSNLSDRSGIGGARCVYMEPRIQYKQIKK